jgi:hypothetical protein
MLFGGAFVVGVEFGASDASSSDPRGGRQAERLDDFCAGAGGVVLFSSINSRAEFGFTEITCICSYLFGRNARDSLFRCAKVFWF